MQPLSLKPEPLSEPRASSRNRRGCVRQRVHSPAYAGVIVNSTSTAPDQNEILDISENGIAFQNASQMEAGCQVQLSLDLSETAGGIEAIGEVAWSDPSGRTGVGFPQMPASSLRLLKEWLFINLVAACVRHAAQAQLLHSEMPAQVPEPPSLVPTPQREEVAPPGLRDYSSILNTLALIRKQVRAKPGLDASLQLVADYARSFTGATGTAIAISDGEEMLCRARAGADAPEVGARFQLGSGFSGECVRSGRLLRCDDCETDPRVDRDTCRSLGIRSMMAVPVRCGETVIGLLEVFSPEPFAFGARDRIFLQRLAEFVLAAVDRALQALEGGEGLSATSTPAETLPQPTVLGFEEFGGGEIGSETPSSAEPPDNTSSPFLHLLHFRRTIAIVAVAAMVVLTALLVPWIRSQAGPGQTSSQTRVPTPKKALQPPAGNPESELESLRKLAEQGDATAQFAMGARYAIGEDVAQDYSTAARWFDLAANQGHVVAQATLGAYYWSGTGVPQDLDKAYFWSVLAQAGGDEASKYRLAALASRLSRGQIIAAQEEANDWLRQHQLSAKDSSRSR